MTAPYSGESPFRRVRRVHLGTAPGAGADWSVTVDAGRTWRLISVLAQLVTSSHAATREVDLTISDGTTTYFASAPAATQTASLTRKYCWAAKVSALALGVAINQGIPEFTLPAGHVIAVTTQNIDTADQWGAPVLYVIETTVREGAIELSESPDMVVELFSGPAPQ